MKKGQLVSLKDDDRVGIVVEIFESSFQAPYGPWYTIYWIATGTRQDLHQSRLLPFDDEELTWRTWGDI
tara:strand:+ start:73 stop:279 length:207 start_codon:yes stop_codon:yes gene_type:complete